MAKGVNYKNIPNCLRKYRKERGLKQKEVAEILGLKSISMISRWEKGICLPETLNLFKLAIIYRTMVDALFIDLMKSLKDELHKREKK
jgi:transcriptional regulator with XRE-family HTH domain